MIVLEAGSVALYTATVTTIALVAAFARGDARREAAREVLAILFRGKSAFRGTEEEPPGPVRQR
jgi:hypothetical protein